MAFPKQVTPPTHRSQAPYNFVPLPEKVYCPQGRLPDHDRFEPERHSGYIPITLTTETWLYIRAGVTPAYAEAHPEQNPAIWDAHSEYRNFFHHGDPSRPAVPGSELRGMLRQLIEVMSAASLETASNEPIVYRAVGDPTRFGGDYRQRFVGPDLVGTPAQTPGTHSHEFEYPLRDTVKGGYLFRRGRDWFIQPATPDTTGETFIQVDEKTGGWSGPGSLGAAANQQAGLEVWVRPAGRQPHRHRGGTLLLHYPLSPNPPVPRSKDQPPGTVRGFLVFTAGLPGKHLHAVIYEPDLARGPIPVPRAMQRQYLADAAAPRAAGRTGRILARAVMDVPEWAGPPAQFPGFPCFFMVDGSGRLVFLGGTLFFRLPYQRTPRDFVPGRQPDDLVRQLLGGVGGGGPRKGRLRFEDLTLADGVNPAAVFVQGPERSPLPLLAPKPACIQHYLVQPQDAGNDRLHYDDDPYDPARGSGDTVLRGFKHYWHRRGPDADPSAVARGSVTDWRQVAGPERRTRTVLRPLREGVCFQGRIYFDNLTDIELGALLMALDLPPGLRHKLGMARPLGFGSVRIQPGRVRLIDPAKRYRTFFAPAGTAPDPDTGVLEAGWRADGASVASNARKAFARALLEHEGDPCPPGVSPEEAERRFWQLPRMCELRALLSWEKAPPADSTEQRGVEGLGRDQWRRRWILPPATEVLRASAGTRRGGVPPPGGAAGPGGGSPRDQGSPGPPRPGGGSPPGGRRPGGPRLRPMDDAYAALGAITFTRYVLRLEAETPLVLPEYAGSAFRGGFGQALLRVACRGGGCPPCRNPERCAYGYIFESPRPAWAELFPKVSHVPHPYVIEPPAGGAYEPGQSLSLNLVLIGRGAEFVGPCLHAFSELGRLGVGKGRGRYRLLGATREPGGPQAPEPVGVSGGIRVDFLTPTRIREDAQLQDQVPFPLLVKALLRRLEELAYFHCGCRARFDWPGLLEAAAAIVTARQDLRWLDWARWSSRQQAHLLLGGVVGRATYDGPVGPFIPYLRLGEALHVGKGTAFGLGQMRLRRA